MLTDSQVSTLFDYAHVERQASYLTDMEEPYYFRRRQHGIKVPTSELDPHVALLVKALSATGCFSFSSCDGHEADSPCGAMPLQVELVGEMSSAWAKYMLDQAANAGIEFSGLRLNDCCWCLEERLTAAELETRELVLIRRQAIELGQFLYSNRLRFRQERIQWMKTFQPRANGTNTPNNTHRTPVEFRVRLSDSSGFAVEFSVGGYRELDERCRAAFLSWQALHPREKRKPGWFAQQELDELEAQSLLAHEELRACELELREATEPMSPNDISGFLHKIQAVRQHVERFNYQRQLRTAPVLKIEIAASAHGEWRAPWGDSKPVRIRIMRTDSADNPENWRFVFRRTGLKGHTSSTQSWLLLWMGFREAFRDVI
ncbi:hypothetical protein CXL00_08845 [Stutzerimonas stutzeri]|uniref:Uncharacterized protein n=1 Tax=Stutzerimonas stutzeri TaxID=316 RepID=A0A2N8STZ1_STUST|nr:hypothetical protein CXL00_08845 [Stutzerimonas stutzeri]